MGNAAIEKTLTNGTTLLIWIMDDSVSIHAPVYVSWSFLEVIEVWVMVRAASGVVVCYACLFYPFDTS